MTIKDAFQFGIEPVRITDTDNIQINEGLPTNADPQVYAFELAKLVKTMLNGVLKSAQENIPFPVEVLPTRNSLPTPIIAHTLADRSVLVPVRGGTDIAYYNGEDKGVFMLAKRFTALSFGCFRHDGENITVVLSRDGDSQSHDLEILGKVFVVAEAATTVKMGTGSATAVLPVVKRLKFTKTEA